MSSPPSASVSAAPLPLKKRLRKFFVRAGRRVVEAFEHWLGAISPVGDGEILDNKDFPWARQLEENWETIRRELDAVLVDRAHFPNIQDISAEQRYLTKDGGWKTFFFHAYGHAARENCRRCPETAKLVAAIPDLQVAYFSILEPGKHIPAHKGVYKGLIRAHLGLIVPEPRENVRMRVGEKMVHWREGECVVFDDTYEHEVWNDADGWRVVLLIDVVRPLPFPMSFLNRATLRALRGSSFVKDSIRKHDDWEKGFYGASEDILSATPPPSAAPTPPPVNGGGGWPRSPPALFPRLRGKWREAPKGATLPRMRKPNVNARKLRQEMPPAEKRLWRFIRRKQLGGFRFRRQHSIGPFIADFACVEANLVIELDGDQHGIDDAPIRDAARDAFMEREGWVVLRFWNHEIYDNIDGVRDTILDAAKNAAREREFARNETP